MRFRLPGLVNSKPVVEEHTPQDAENTLAELKEQNVDEKQVTTPEDDSDTEYQHGDQAIRAMTQIWTRKHLIIAYLL